VRRQSVFAILALKLSLFSVRQG